MLALLAADAAEGYLVGGLASFGALLLLLFGIARYARTFITEAVVAYLSSPESELTRHKTDPLAHEVMRTALMTRFEEKIGELKEAIIMNDTHQREDARAFQQNVIQPMMKQTDAMLSMLSSQMRRSGTHSNEDHN